MTLNLLTLKFSEESSPLEAPFLRDYYQVSLPQIRIALLLGAFFYAAFGHLDAVLMPEQKSTIWLIRFIIACPVFLGTYLISFTRFFERFTQPVLAGNIILAGAGIVGMIDIAPTPINYYYYAGLLLVIVWGYTFVRLRFIWALLAGWVQVALYEIVAIWITPTPYEVLLSNNFFFISMSGIGMLACYSIEFYARRDFFMTYRLEVERENVQKINQELEERVEKRTIEYQIANRELQREIKDHKKAETQKKAAVEALQESEKMYRALVESASDMVYRTNVDGYFTFINASAVRITGYDEKETIGKHYSVFIHPDQRESAVKFFNHQFDTMLQNTYSEYPIVTKDGRDVWLGQNTQLIVENGEVAGFQAVSRDITENKMMEKEQKVS
jgi:PAS domain S-box-containing protein